MFSRPVSSGLKPAPSSSSDVTRPDVATDPPSGSSTPATSCSSVLLPHPFGPMTPTVVPASMRSDTSDSAHSASARAGRAAAPSTRSLRLEARWCDSQKRLDTRSTTTAEAADTRRV